MRIFLGRKGFAVVVLCAAASYVLMHVRRICGAMGSECYYAAQTFLLIIAWAAGLLTAGGFIFVNTSFAGIHKYLYKAAGIMVSAAVTYAAVWLIASFSAA